jgi:hypothetical protein
MRRKFDPFSGVYLWPSTQRSGCYYSHCWTYSPIEHRLMSRFAPMLSALLIILTTVYCRLFSLPLRLFPSSTAIYWRPVSSPLRLFPSSTAIYWRPVSSPLRHFPTIVICYEHFFAAFWEEKKGRARTSLSVPGLALRVYSSKLSRHELGPFAYCRHWSVLRLRLRDLRYGIHQVQPLPLLLGRPWSEGPFYRHLSGLLDVAHADCWRRRDCGANQGFPYQQGQEQRLKFSSKPRSSIYQPCTPPPF